MRLIQIDPRLLRDNPDNPRRTPAGPEADAALRANIKEVGILQPPTAREKDGTFHLIAGHRRRDQAIVLEMPLIDVLLRDPGDDIVPGADRVQAFSENTMRAGMNPVDQWRAIEALVGESWTEDAIAAALHLPVRRIRALRQLAHVHPAMLDQMARGDMPSDADLRTIGLASRDEQAAVWKRHKPKKNEHAAWHMIAAALSKRRISFSAARFGEAETEAFGIVWQDDLFMPADQESRYTTQVDAFLQAQHAWLEANLPGNGVVLALDDYGSPKLPPKAIRVWHDKPRAKDQVGLYVDPRTGDIGQVLFQLPSANEESRKAHTRAGDAKQPRPDLTLKGQAMVGDLRTEALHAALQEAEISDQTLVGLLVLALAGRNVSIRTGAQGDDLRWNEPAAIAAGITEGGLLTTDPEALRAAARRMLRQALSCRVGDSSSGMVARHAGVAIDADRYLPTTATEEFLSNLSKAAIEATARANNVLPRATGKATRAAIVEQLKGSDFLHPLVRFALSDEERQQEAARHADLHVERDDVGDGDAPLDDNIPQTGPADPDEAAQPSTPTAIEPAHAA